MALFINYEDSYIGDCEPVNLEWLEKFNLVESHDLEIIHYAFGGNRSNFQNS